MLYKKGSSGEDVKKIQQALNAAGGYGLDVDGIYGSKTRDAVTRYQQSNGLGVDGIVGSETWGKLFGGGGGTQNNAAAAPQTTAPAKQKTPLGTEYDPGKTTGNMADLGMLEGKTPSFEESQAYQDAVAQLRAHQSAKPGEYASPYEDRLNALHEQIVGRGEYQSQYAPQIEQALKEYQGSRYESPYAGRIEEIYNQVMDRGDFKYDFNADPLYHMYKDQYTAGGKRAMQDAMAEAAALSGGYGNSYAATAGNQAYQQYLSQLNGVIPELHSQAYNEWLNSGQELKNMLSLTQGLDESAYGRYLDETGRLLNSIQVRQGLDKSAYGRYQDAGNELYNRLSATQGMDESAYNRWRDQNGDWYTDLEYLTGAAQDAYNRDYGAYQDAMDKYLADRDYYYGKTQDDQAQQNYEDEQALAMAAAAASGGGSGSGGGSRGGSKSSGTGGTSGDYKTVLNNAKNMSGQKAFDYVGRMVDAGLITAEEGDRILAVEIGLDLSQYAVTPSTSGVKTVTNAAKNAKKANALLYNNDRLNKKK